MIIPNLPTHFQRTENEVGDMDSASKGKNQNAAVQQAPRAPPGPSQPLYTKAALTSQPTRHLQNSASSPWVSVKVEDSQPES